MIIDECSWWHRKLTLVYMILIYVFALFFIIGGPFILIFCLTPQSMFAIYSILYAVFLVAIVLAYIFIQQRWGEATKSIILKNSSHQPIVEYHSIILAHTTQSDDKGKFPITDYYDPIDILINYFASNEPPIPFRVREITTRNEAIDAISDSNAQFLWIFGHGQRNFLGLSDGFLCYRDLVDLVNDPKKNLQKKFVGQYHCNSPCGTSLADVVHAQESDVTIFPRYPLFTRWAIYRKLKDLKNKKMI